MFFVFADEEISLEKKEEAKKVSDAYYNKHKTMLLKREIDLEERIEKIFASIAAVKYQGDSSGITTTDDDLVADVLKEYGYRVNRTIDKKYPMIIRW